MVRSVTTNEDIVSLPSVRGWCPTLFEPMAAADGLLANVKPRVSGWMAVDLRAIAAAAGLHGSGRLLLTNRANLQVRGLSVASAGAFAAAMVSGGLASADRDAERRRNVLMLEPQTRESQAFAARLEAWLEAEEALAGLPSKFYFGVTSDLNHDHCTAADVCIHVLGQQAWVTAGAGETEEVGGLGVLTAEPLTAVASVTAAFLRLAAQRRARARRLKDLIADVGKGAVFAAAGLQATTWTRRLPQESPARAPQETVTHVGSLTGQRFGLGAPFGRVDVAMLQAVAALAERFGDGRLRLTAHRTIALFGAMPDRHSELAAQASRAGFIVDDRDSRLRVAACVGGAGCNRTTVDVHAVAATLAPLWSGKGVLHVSGCTKGCAHPRKATVTVVPGATDDCLYVSRNSRADAGTTVIMTLAEVMRLLADVAAGGSP